MNVWMVKTRITYFHSNKSILVTMVTCEIQGKKQFFLQKCHSMWENSEVFLRRTSFEVCVCPLKIHEKTFTFKSKYNLHSSLLKTWKVKTRFFSQLNAHLNAGHPRELPNVTSMWQSTLNKKTTADACSHPAKSRARLHITFQGNTWTPTRMSALRMCVSWLSVSDARTWEFRLELSNQPQSPISWVLRTAQRAGSSCSHWSRSKLWTLHQYYCL